MWHYLFNMTIAPKKQKKLCQIAHLLWLKPPTSLTKHRATIVSHHCTRHHYEHQIMAMRKSKGWAKSKACQATQASQKKERKN